jgi:SPP1 family predicted phage head-tail adaptor
MQIGKLRHQVEHQRPTEDVADSGQVTKTYATVGTYWASISTLSGKEGYWAKEMRAEVTHSITMRAASGSVGIEDRLKFGSRVFNVAEVNDVDERGEVLKVLAIEVL